MRRRLGKEGRGMGNGDPAQSARLGGGGLSARGNRGFLKFKRGLWDFCCGGGRRAQFLKRDLLGGKDGIARREERGFKETKRLPS
jgi:hypothetical protein